MTAEERLRRLLSWCRFAALPSDWNHETAERCRQLLPQIAAAAIKVKLPKMFHVPFSRYLNNDPTIGEIIDDDDRLLLMLSDLQDYLDLMQKGFR